MLWIAKSQYSHSTRFSEMRSTESRGLTPAAIRADATASTWRRMSDQVSPCQSPPTLWWTRGLSPYLAACVKKTPTVVRSGMAAGSRSCAVAFDSVTDVVLLDRFDGERQCAGGNAHGDLVALLPADQRAPDGGVDRDAPRGWVALHGAYQLVGLRLTLVVDDLDRRARTHHARVRFLDDLRPADHLLELVDPAGEETALLLRLLVLRVVLDVSRLKRLHEALARFDTAPQSDLQVAFELLEPLGSQQDRFS